MKESYKTFKTYLIWQILTAKRVIVSVISHIIHSAAHFELKVQTHWTFITIASWLMWLCISYLAYVLSLKEVEDQLMMNCGESGHG